METKKEKLTILVCAHKPDEHIRNYPPYKAIQVGAALHPEMDLGFLKDNVGDNISEKNPKYCEWSALYWGWKNLKNVEYKGLAHYRRYFDIDFRKEIIDKMIEGYDIIVTSKNYGIKNNFDFYGSSVSYDNAFIFLDTLMSLYPDCKIAALNYLFNNNKYTVCSMFIAKSEIYDDFCDFAFNILFAMEKKIKDSGYSRINRTLAYTGELLLGLYIEYKGLREKIVPMKAIGVSSFQFSLKSKMLFNIKNKLLYRKRISELPKPDSAIMVGYKMDGIKLDYF